MGRRVLGLAVSLALLCTAQAAAQVVYVGDSLGVGTAPQVRERLPGVSVDVDARTSRPSSVGLSLLSSLLEPRHEVVVFDLGTNDDPGAPEALSANLAGLRDIAGDRCIVVATLNRPPLNGVPVDALNGAIETFARSDPAVRLVDWHSAAASDPALLADGVHATGSGYELRGELFADAVRACLTGTATTAQRPPQGPPRTLPSPRPQRQPQPAAQPRPDPVEEVAAELAKAIVVGAEFG